MISVYYFIGGYNMRYLTKNGSEMEVSIVTLFALSKSVLNGSYVTIQDIAENVKYIFSKKGAYNILLDATLISFDLEEKEAYERMLQHHFKIK